MITSQKNTQQKEQNKPALKTIPNNQAVPQQEQLIEPIPVLIQRAIEMPESIAPADAKRLQRTIGNQAVGQLNVQTAVLQRQPHSSTPPTSPMTSLQTLVNNQTELGIQAKSVGPTPFHKHNYSVTEAKAILDDSEGQNSPVTGQPAHPRQHSDRVKAHAYAASVNKGGKTTFQSADDQDQAVSEVLQNSLSDLEAFQGSITPGASSRTKLESAVSPKTADKVKPNGSSINGWPKTISNTVVIVDGKLTESTSGHITGEIFVQTAYPTG